MVHAANAYTITKAKQHPKRKLTDVFSHIKCVFKYPNIPCIMDVNLMGHNVQHEGCIAKYTSCSISNISNVQYK